MPRKTNPMERCSSCNKLISEIQFERTTKASHKMFSTKIFPQKVKNFPSHFLTKIFYKNRLILYLHPLRLLRISFLIVAFSHRSLRIINFFITNKTVSHQRSIPSTYENVELSIYGDSPALHSELQPAQHFLRDSVLELSRKKDHNFKIREIHHEIVIKKDYTHNELSSSAKINFSFGFVLQSVQNPEELRYYYAADSVSIFLNPMFEHDYDVAASQTFVLYNVKEGNLDNATEHETSELLNSIQISPLILWSSEGENTFQYSVSCQAPPLPEACPLRTFIWASCVVSRCIHALKIKEFPAFLLLMDIWTKIVLPEAT